MKTTTFVKHLLVAGFILVGNLSISAARPNNDFVYNTEEVNGMKVSETVYKMERGFLTNFQKYNYKYNEDRQVTENILQRWDAEQNKWRNDMCIKYVYTGNAVTIHYYRWNNTKKEFILQPRMTATMNN